MALSKGYRRIIAEIEERIASFQPTGIQDAAKLHFWRAAKRAPRKERWSMRKTTPTRRIAWPRPSRTRPARPACGRWPTACRRVPAETPRNFREAVQAFWFTYLLGHLEGSHLGYSPGRLDQLLHPYFENDGTCGYDEAVELFEELFVKMTQIEYVASLSWQGLGHGNLYQNCILGGVDAEGKPADNETSLAILDAQIHMQMTQPTLSVWYDDSLSEKFLLKAVQCVKTGVWISGLLQPEDLRRARTPDQRPAAGYDPQAGGHRRLHRARAPGHELWRGAGGLRESRQVAGSGDQRRRGSAHAGSPFRTGGAAELRRHPAVLHGQDARCHPQLAAVLELRDARPPQHGAVGVLLGFRAGLPGTRPVHGRWRRDPEPDAHDP